MYIFEINSLSVASFAIIFSHSEGCLFTLLIVSFDVQKLLSLIRSHLFIFAFISNILGGGLIYISVFVPVPYCLDDCGFVVEPEVRQVYSSSSILLSQDCLAIRGFLYFHINCEIMCSSSVKNTVGSLIGIALNL